MAERPTARRYIFWNNKGGVGKTTLCFHSATHYAKEHNEQKVLVVDMCPQSNISLSLLTRSPSPPTPRSIHPMRSMEKTLQKHSRKRPAHDTSCSERFAQYDVVPPVRVRSSTAIAMSRGSPPRTVVGYLQQELVTPGRQEREPERYFVVRVCDHNKSVNDNLYLLCGDANLDLISKMLEHKRQGPGIATIYNPWKEVTTCLDKFITNYTEQESGDWVVFIDTNPALTLYTEMSLAAADLLVIPCSADVYSKHAMSVLFWMIYGIESQSNPILDAVTFNSLAAKHGVKKPKVHLIVNNRATIHATSDVAEEIKLNAFSVYETAKDCFSMAQNVDVSLNIQQFEEKYTCETRDFHTNGVESMHHGQPFYCVQKRGHNLCDLTPEVYGDRLDCEDAISSLVKMLD